MSLIWLSAHGAGLEGAESAYQTDPDSLWVDSTYKEAITHFVNNRLEEGLAMLDTVLKLTRRNGYYEMLINAENDKVRALEFLGMNSLEVLRGYDAIDRETLPLMEEPGPGHAKTWYNLGMWYHGAARYHLARDYLLRALSVMEKVEDRGFMFQRAMVYNILGMTYEGLGHHSLALDYFRESIAVREEMFGENTTRTTVVRINMIATMLSSGNMDGAERELDKVRETLVQADEDPLEDIIYLESKADVLRAAGDYEAAFEVFKRFETLLLRGELVEDLEVEAAVDRAALLSQLNRWDEAEACLKEKLKVVTGDQVKVFLYKGLTDLYIKWGRPSLAVKYAAIAEAFYFPEGREAVSSPSDLISGVKHSLSALASTAAALDLYADSTEQNADRGAVLNMIDEAERVFSVAKQRADAGELINLREQGWFDIYETGMKNAHILHETTGDNEWMERAWKFSEDAKSAALLTSVNRLGPEITEVIPGEEVQDELRLRNELAYFEERFKGGELNPDERLEFLHKRLALDSLMDTYQTKYPLYSKMRFDPPGLSLDEAAARARNGRSVLTFLSGEEMVYGIAVTSAGARLEVLGRSDSISNAVSQYRSAINTRPVTADFELAASDLKSAGKALYEMIAAPLFDRTDLGDHLLIIPDGPLHYLPFETLNSTTSGNVTDYFIFDVDISYAYSYTAFKESTTAGMDFLGDFLGLAPAFESDGTWRSLAGARAEIESVAERFPDGITRMDTANYDWFMDHKGKYRVLHFATHAYADEVEPMSSALLLDGGGAAGRSGVLRASDLYSMRIPAEMVVLSACNTGTGPVRRGEGVMSLAHGFAYAGSPSVVMTLWPANDEAIKDLMDVFYANLTKGKSKSASISEAKRAYLKGADGYTAHPYFWANLISIGNDDALTLEGRTDIPAWVWVSGGFILIGGIWILRRKRAY